jgi:hypothetical protein
MLPVHRCNLDVCLCVCAAALLFIQIILTGWVETKRWLDFKNPGSQGDGSFLGVTDDFKPMDNGYPGGKFFDPFGLSRGSEAQLKKYQVQLWDICLTQKL